MLALADGQQPGQGLASLSRPPRSGRVTVSRGRPAVVFLTHSASRLADLGDQLAATAAVSWLVGHQFAQEAEHRAEHLAAGGGHALALRQQFGFPLLRSALTVSSTRRLGLGPQQHLQPPPQLLHAAGQIHLVHVRSASSAARARSCLADSVASSLSSIVSSVTST